MDSSRRITEAAVLSAVAHPLRRRLLDVLRVHGDATVGRLAERTGAAVGSVSHHVRVLEDVGLVETAPELARDRRERWWRLVSRRLTWDEDDFDDTPHGVAAADAATQLGLQRQLELTRAWLATSREEPQWRRSAVSSDAWLSLSPAELSELGREIGLLLDRFRDRSGIGDDARRRPVFVFARGFPATP